VPKYNDSGLNAIVRTQGETQRDTSKQFLLFMVLKCKKAPTQGLLAAARLQELFRKTLLLPLGPYARAAGRAD
jgi:hypothetical protein